MEENTISYYMSDGFAAMGCYSEYGGLLQLVVSIYCSPALYPCTRFNESHSFQDVQLLSPIQTSLRFLPGIIIGVFLNISTGLFIQHMRIDLLLTIVSVFAAVSPLLLAVTDPKWSYWYTGFWSVLLSPVSVDGTCTP